MEQLAFMGWGFLIGWCFIPRKKAGLTTEHKIGEQVLRAVHRGQGHLRFAPNCRWSQGFTLTHKDGSLSRMLLVLHGDQYEEEDE